MGTNDSILLVVALFFGCLLLAIHYEELRTADRRKQELGPPSGIERRSVPDRRRDSLGAYLEWVVRAFFKRLTRWFRT